MVFKLDLERWEGVGDETEAPAHMYTYGCSTLMDGESPHDTAITLQLKTRKLGK